MLSYLTYRHFPFHLYPFILCKVIVIFSIGSIDKWAEIYSLEMLEVYLNKLAIAFLSSLLSRIFGVSRNNTSFVGWL